MNDLLFPNAPRGHITTTSNATDAYNCLAWAVWCDDYQIWPDELEQLSWPPSLARDDTVEAIQSFLHLAGYVSCERGDFEIGFEKIAIYERDGVPSHVARQCADGGWTSKLGPLADVHHQTLEDLADQYGLASAFMKRRADGLPPKLPELFPARARLVDQYGSRLL